MSNYKNIIKKILDEEITTTQGRKIKAKEALLRSLVKQAIAGDTRALTILLSYIDFDEIFNQKEVATILKEADGRHRKQNTASTTGD